MNQPSSTSAVTQLGADLSHSRVAYIEASWHHDIVSQARTTFTEKVAERGISQIDVFAVPRRVTAAAVRLQRSQPVL